MTKTRLLIENVIYHITSRGNHKETIFKDIFDFNFYISQLKLYKKRYSFSLYGYCLMPNHIHLIGSPENPKELSKFMQGLHRSYTAYHNKKYKKVGHLWQGRFKSRVIKKDPYLINAISYVELNPVRSAIINNPKDYKFSSYSERVLDAGRNSKLLNKLTLE